MRVVLSIILMVTLLVMVFYGNDYKEDFYGPLGDITEPQCCGQGMQGPSGQVGVDGDIPLGSFVLWNTADSVIPTGWTQAEASISTDELTLIKYTDV
jgi:hypothetical protein